MRIKSLNRLLIFSLSFGLLACFLLISFKSLAQPKQPVPTTVGAYDMSLSGTRTFPTGSPTYTIYDDGLFGNWNCGDDYVTTAYAGDAVNFVYTGLGYFPRSGTCENFVVIKDRATSTTIYSGYVTNSGTATVAGTASFSYTFSSSGNYSVAVSYMPTSTSTRTLTGRVDAQNKIDKIWLEIPEVCASDYLQNHANEDFAFKLKTSPVALNTVPLSEAQGEVGPAPCLLYDPIGMGISGSSAGSAVIYNTNIPGSSSYPDYGLLIQGSGWSTTPPLPDLEDYNIPWSDFVNYITPPAAGHSWVTPGNITFTVWDGIQTFTATAAVKIDHPNSSTDPTPSSASFDFDNYTISGGQIWTPTSNPITAAGGATTASTIRIEHTLNIVPGTALTLQNMTLEFGPDGKIDVQTYPGLGLPGGELRLDNSTLTSVTGCDFDYYWQGVRVWGDASKDQASHTFGGFPGTYQGYFNMSNGSVISNASWGITNSGPKLSTAWDRNGGAIFASDSHFENNLRAVNYGIFPVPGITNPAPHAYYASSFDNCDFTSNRPFIGFIGGWAVNGVKVLGTSFQYSTVVYGATNGLGVYGSDFGVSINKDAVSGTSSSFSNLEKGVDIGAVSGVGTTTVRNSTFSNNTVGVEVDGVPVPYVRYNTFSELSAPSSPANQSIIGTFVNTGSGFLISDNSYSGSASNIRNTGVLISNTGTAGTVNNSVHANTYSNLSTASLSNYINRGAGTGLEFACNSYTSNKWDIAARGNDATTNGMATDQGSPTVSIGNQFTSTIAYNLYNPTGEVGAINYYYYGVGSNQMPTAAFGGVHTVGAGTSNLCSYTTDDDATRYNIPPPGSGGGITGAVSYYLSDPDGMALHDSLYAALDTWTSPYSDLLRADVHLEDGDPTTANTIYNGIVTTYSLTGLEATEFNTWGRRLMDIRIDLQSNGKTVMDIDSDQMHLIEGVADSAAIWARTRAQNWLSLYDGRTFTVDKLFPLDTESDGGMRRAPIAAPQYTLSPNPATETLQINFSKAHDVDEIFTLIDIVGRPVLQTTLSGISGTVLMDIHHLQPGIYVYRISENGVDKQTGRVTKE